jgi:Zn finger protein HypA/HybF involved in hydrogenase expression
MHETIFAEEIIEKARSQGHVRGITVEVGELAELTAEELCDALKNMVGWQIKIIKAKSLAQCHCGYRGQPKITERMHGIVLFECPRCSETPKIVSGKEIRLMRVES